MTRTAFSFQVDDISVLARSLHRQLSEADTPATHLSLMNMLARAAGFRNFQHLRASSTPVAASAPPDRKRVDQILRYFDDKARLTRWPAKTTAQHLALWALWARLPKAEAMTERQISAVLNEWHLFGDPAILRRTLWEMKLVSRSLDGHDYRRVEVAPPPDARALIRALHQAS
jgi:hypothetical protein